MKWGHWLGFAAVLFIGYMVGVYYPKYGKTIWSKLGMSGQ